jgi:hypothetical protein
MSNKNPLINVVTRTSGRPEFFKRNVNSINSQTYKNIRHVIITDSKDNVSYIKNNGIEEYYIYDPIYLVKNDKTKDPKTGRLSAHNLYFNEVHKEIKEGWIIYIDDDDYFMDQHSLSKLVTHINKYNEDTLIYFQMEWGSKNIKIPSEIKNRKVLFPFGSEKWTPQLARIGGSCLIFHSKYKDFAMWDKWKCSDFRVISKLHNKIPNKVCIVEPFVKVPLAGKGERNDLK